MREKLNSNPLVQVAVIGVLLLGAAIFVLSMGGGGKEEAESTTPTETATAPEGAASVTATVETTGEAGVPAAPGSVPALPPGAAAAAPPPPRAVIKAFQANQTVALLFTRNGGIDDRLVVGAVNRLRSLPGVSPFVVPAGRIYRYAAIAQGVAVDRVPALVVLRPKRLNKGIPVASVYYGFQSSESVVQAVVDAGYKGRTLDYHP
jgi:hypothetical protein